LVNKESFLLISADTLAGLIEGINAAIQTTTIQILKNSKDSHSGLLAVIPEFKDCYKDVNYKLVDTANRVVIEGSLDDAYVVYHEEKFCNNEGVGEFKTTLRERSKGSTLATIKPKQPSQISPQPSPTDFLASNVMANVRPPRFFNLQDLNRCDENTCALKSGKGGIRISNRLMWHSFQPRGGYIWNPTTTISSETRIDSWFFDNSNSEIQAEIREDMQVKGLSLDDLRDIEFDGDINPLEALEEFNRVVNSLTPLGNAITSPHSLENTAVRLGRAVIERNAEPLVNEMRALGNLSTFFGGASRDLANRFVDRFVAGTGGIFADPLLTENMQNSSEMRRFARDFTTFLEDSIERNNGNLRQTVLDRDLNARSGGGNNFMRNEDGVFHNELLNIDRPRFNKIGNLLNDGLFFKINGTHRVEVRIINYIFCPLCKNYTATLRITVIDHFGLDRGDVKGRARPFMPAININNMGHWGVYGWYVLQHYRGFSNGYKPFITEGNPEIAIGRQSRPNRSGGTTWI